MAKKFIEFLEAAALIILTGVIVVGVMKYVDTKEEPKEEDPIVETTTATISIGGPGTVTLEFEYTEGMTWGEVLESNEFEEISVSEDGFILVTEKNINYGPCYLMAADAVTTEQIKTDSIVDLSSVYSFGENYQE